eukprot:TRINITY_DN6578_c0_g2_i1.p1 TRINITY_DN6578_c0_g2~~TRINITY_DN6578_c0_g2_i1.p1  ORF type:complete len:221 (+),score=35.25 TRINITY_DN6578_c0_g2_i1:607-1269(+)
MQSKQPSEKGNSGDAPVYLNVYDLTPINGYTHWFGLGIYHSGIEVHGVEYGFGAHEYSSSGVFEVEPKKCPGFTFRKSICMGATNLCPRTLRDFIEHLAAYYNGNSYHLIVKNCNHFSNDVCLKLTGNPIPRWVNRLARLGLFCNCVLPVGLHVAAVKKPSPVQFYEGEKKQVSNSLGCIRGSMSARHRTSVAVPSMLLTSSLKGRDITAWDSKSENMVK